MDRVRAARKARGSLWRLSAKDPLHPTIEDLERALITLPDEDWNTRFQIPSTRDKQGRVNTGDAVADEWERQAWERAEASRGN